MWNEHERKRLDYRQHFEFLMRIRRYWNWVNILCLLTAWIDLWPRGCCISARWFTEGHQSQRQGYISINSVYISFIFPVANWFRFLSARFCHFYRSAVFYQLGFFLAFFQHHFTVRFIVVFAESFSTFCRHFFAPVLHFNLPQTLIDGVESVGQFRCHFCPILRHFGLFFSSFCFGFDFSGYLTKKFLMKYF